MQCDGNFLVREALYPAPWPFLRWSPAWSSSLFLPGPEQQPSADSTSRMWPCPGTPSTCLNTPPLSGSRLERDLQSLLSLRHGASLQTEPAGGPILPGFHASPDLLFVTCSTNSPAAHLWLVKAPHPPSLPRWILV